MEAIPPTGDELVAALDERFPLRNPTPKMTFADIQYNAGQRSVVEFLLQLQSQEK